MSTTDVTTLSPVSEAAAPPSTAQLQNDEDLGLFDEHHLNCPSWNPH